MNSGPIIEQEENSEEDECEADIEMKEEEKNDFLAKFLILNQIVMSWGCFYKDCNSKFIMQWSALISTDYTLCSLHKKIKCNPPNPF